MQQVSADLDRAMRAACLKPLWVHYRDLGSLQPNRMERPMHWRWTDMQQAIAKTAEQVSMEHAERRALILANPFFEPGIQTTRNLIGALQILNPGDSADEHRHTMAAIRMIIEADGGFTSVDGERYEMQHGDLILTPSWTWHAHANTTPRRIVWVDGLDVPFVRNSLDAAFFDPHAPAGLFDGPAHPADNWRWAENALAPAEADAGIVPHSPKMRYSWQATAATLDRLPPGPDGHVRLRYVHPQTGQAIMATLDCFMLRLQGRGVTLRRRSTSNAFCVVLEGEGRSSIGDTTIHWKKNDIFTIPHWTWASHQTTDERAHLFLLTDRELYRRLNLLREETDS